MKKRTKWGATDVPPKIIRMHPIVRSETSVDFQNSLWARSQQKSTCRAPLFPLFRNPIRPLQCTYTNMRYGRNEGTRKKKVHTQVPIINPGGNLKEPLGCPDGTQVSPSSHPVGVWIWAAIAFPCSLL